MISVIVRPLKKEGLMALMCFTVGTVARPLRSLANECPDCGCDLDDHDGTFCNNCGENCEIDE